MNEPAPPRFVSVANPALINLPGTPTPRAPAAAAAQTNMVAYSSLLSNGIACCSKGS